MRQLGGKARIGVTAVFFSLSAALIAGSIVETALANPTAPTVTAGGATVSGLGTNAVTIHQATPKAIINWQQFNIAPNEVTRFIQPSGSAIALNRIFDANPSQIFGSLQANGSVILLNPNGIMFGPNAQVNVNGLIDQQLGQECGDDQRRRRRRVFAGAQRGKQRRHYQSRGKHCLGGGHQRVSLEPCGRTWTARRGDGAGR
jgi:filamentous hemagglutinin family protein